MTVEFMQKLLSKDEKITIEYKECQKGIQEDVYETVCSFSNRYGGYIIMGVKDGGIPIGINRNLIKDMKKNFVNQLNNPEKMSPTLYLSIDDFEYEGMALLWVYVPPTSTVEKCANRIYDRNEDGDMDITDSPIQLQNLYKRKSDTYTERRIFPYVTTDDLRMDLMDKVRNLAKSKNANHAWLEMSDDEILKSAGLWEKDFSSGFCGKTHIG
jgi:ATP-dependent DNA helicase RecG